VEEPPVGTIALLFTDIEGSTALASRLGDRWRDVLAAHHAIVGDAIAEEHGYVDGTEGDAFFATFADARRAARAAIAAQRALAAHEWPEPVRVRMGLHAGFVERAATGYVGLEVHRAARVASAAHGGQLLLTASARALIGEVVPVDPLGAHRLKDFPAPEPLFCAVIDGRGASAFPPPRTQELRPTNLPAAGPALVGRDDDLERVSQALLAEGERLVTLTGRGGAGKTSLALAAGAALLDEHPGGVWLSRLATVTNPGDVVSAVAAALGADPGNGHSAEDAIAARLAGRGAALLIADNLEHLLPAAPALAGLLDVAPDLRIIVTSQAPLRLPAERVLPLDALGDDASIALMERVVRRRGGDLGSDRAALVDVVHLLDGLPLALELAAARLALLSPAQLRDRLLESTELLRETGAGRPERQQSLRATVDWTLGLLEAQPRALFTRMGAFAGPAVLEDLEAVGEGLDVLEALAALRDVALVRRVESGDGRIRFGLPEALRQIAAATLDASPDGASWRSAHARRQADIAWAARTLGQAAGADYRAAVAADADAEAALRWARSAGDPAAARLAAARGALLADLGRTHESFATLAPLIETPTGDPSIDGQALSAYGYALLNAGRLEEGIAAADRALALDADPTTRAKALLLRGLLHTFGQEYEEGVRFSEQATALARRTGDHALLSGVMTMEAQARMFAGEVDRAAELFAEAERIGAPVDTAVLWRGETFRGDLARSRGEHAEALAHYASSFVTAQALGNEIQVLLDLECAAWMLALLGRDEAALEAAGLAEALGEEVGGESGMTEVPWQADLAATAERVGEPAASEHRARGRAVPAIARVSRALALARAQRTA
jgi:predicted ATPase/class 3 adenylate cyclase